MLSRSTYTSKWTYYHQDDPPQPVRGRHDSVVVAQLQLRAAVARAGGGGERQMSPQVVDARAVPQQHDWRRWQVSDTKLVSGRSKPVYFVCCV